MSAIKAWVARLLRKAAARLDPPPTGGAHRRLVQDIIDVFRMPRYLRAFTIRWEINKALTVTTESLPWKEGAINPHRLTRLQIFEMREVLREEQPLI